MAKYNLDILFLFEKSSREFESILFASLLCNQLGYTTAIRHQERQSFDSLRTFKPRIVVLPYCYHNRSHSLYFRFWRDSIYISLNWEQFLYKGNLKAKLPKGWLAQSYVKHVSWSDGFTHQLVSSHVPIDNILQIGSLPLALLDLDLQGGYLSKKTLATNHNLNADTKWILFAENFSWLFYSDDMILQMINDGIPRSDIDQLQTYCSQTFYLLIDWCVQLLADQHLTLILRPRPSTASTLIYQRILDYLGYVPANLRIIKSHTVKDWIYASDHVISNASTTLIESSLARKPVSLLEPLHYPDIFRQDWFQLLPTCNTYDDLEANIYNSDITSSNILYNWARTCLLPDRNPIYKLVDELHSLISQHRPHSMRIPLDALLYPNNSFLTYLRFVFAYAYQAILISLRISREHLYDSEYEHDLPSTDYIAKRTSFFNSVLKLPS